MSAEFEYSEKLRDLVLACGILEHGGPLSVVDTFESIELERENLGIYPPLDTHLDTIEELVFSDFFEDISIKVQILESPKNSQYTYDLDETEKQYRDWLSHMTNALGTFIRHSSGNLAESLVRRQLLNISAISLFMSYPDLNTLEPLDIHLWLQDRDWQVKREQRIMGQGTTLEDTDLRVLVDQDVPDVRIASPLLHLSLERLISNGYHDIPKDPNQPENVTLHVYYETARSMVAFNVRNSGLLTETQLELNTQSGLPNLFSLSRQRRAFGSGLGLPFTARAVKKMGGTLEARNIIIANSPYVDMTIRLPKAA